MKTAVCFSGRLTMINNYANLKEHVIDPFNADVFIDSWIPYADNTMRVGLSEQEQRTFTVLPEEEPIILEQFITSFKPKFINLEFFDGIPLTHQIRQVLPKKSMTLSGDPSFGTKKENVLFMWYKIWKCNQLLKQYEQINRIRYDCVIRMRFDASFTSDFPIMQPPIKTVFIPAGGDYGGGICDQVAIADPITMDIYCELYNEIYRYAVAGITIHPESMLLKHLEVNRIGIGRIDCGLSLRGNVQHSRKSKEIEEHVIGTEP